MSHLIGSQTISQMSQPIVGQPQGLVSGQSGGPVVGSSGGSAPTSQPSEQKYDLISKVRQLVWALKDSLANLMKIAANNIQHNSQIDNSLKTSEEKPLRFDKALEDFFSICNQIELHLNTILECAIQARHSQMYLPFNVSKSDNMVDPTSNMAPDSISYNQYIMTIKSQVNFAKAVHDMLIDGAQRITQSDLPINPVINTSTPGANASVV